MAQKRYEISSIGNYFEPITDYWTDNPETALNYYFKGFIKYPTMTAIVCYDPKDAVKLLETFVAKVDVFGTKFFENGVIKGNYKVPLQYFYNESISKLNSGVTGRFVPYGDSVYPFCMG